MNTLSGVSSKAQVIRFHSTNLNSTKSTTFPVSVRATFSAASFSSKEYNFTIEAFISVKSRQIDIPSSRYLEYATIKVTQGAVNVIFNGVRGKIQTIDTNDRRYVIVGVQKYPLFNPLNMKIKHKKIFLKSSSSPLIEVGEPTSYTFGKSTIYGALAGANNAKRIVLNTSFGIVIPGDKKILVGRSNCSCLSPETKWFSIKDRFFDIIKINTPSRAVMDHGYRPTTIGTTASEHKRKTYIIGDTLGGVRSSRMLIRLSRGLQPFRSAELPFRSKTIILGGTRQICSKRKYSVNLDGVHSKEINILRVRSGSSSSRYASFMGTKTNLSSFKASVVSSGDLFHLPESRFFLATHNVLKSKLGIKTSVIRFTIPLYQNISLNGLKSKYISFSGTYESIQRIDLDGIRSNWFNFLVGDMQLVDRKGLYKDIFIDSSGYTPHVDTPWTPRSSTMRHLSKWKSFGISFVSGLDVFAIKKEVAPVMLIDWEKITLERESWEIPLFSIAPYIKIEEKNTNDFIIMASTPVGGSIIHMHLNGYKESFSPTGGYVRDEFLEYDENGDLIEKKSVDSSYAEAAAMVVGSNRYQRFAKILHEADKGVLWEDKYINQAIEYMEEHRERTMFFFDAPYSPTVLKLIITDRQAGLTSKDIFNKPTISCFHNGIENDEETVEFERVPGGEDIKENRCEDNPVFIYEPLDEVPDGDMIYSFVVSHRDILLSKAGMLLDVSFKNTRLGKSVGGVNILNCANTVSCSSFIMGKRSYIDNCIKGAIDPSFKAYAGYYKWQDFFQVKKDKFVHFYVSGIKRTMGGTRSIPFINVVGSAILGRAGMGPIDFHADFGTMFHSLKFVSTMRIGSISLSGVKSIKFNHTVNAFDKSFGRVVADFFIKLTTNRPKSTFNRVYSDKVSISINKGIKRYDGVSNGNVEGIWMKIFPQHYAGKSTIEADIMNLHITTREFEKGFNFPFDYIDDDAVLGRYSSKGGSGDFKEKKSLEVDDIGESDIVSMNRADLICGSSRSTTILEFQNFDHIFRSGDNQIFGNTTWEDKKTLMSAYLRIRINKVIRRGVLISEADTLRRTLTEVKLSYIEDLDTVEDWHIEDFKLEAVDFGLRADQAEQLDSIDEVFKAALKAVMENIGDDSVEREKSTSENQFPAFPERVSPKNELGTTLKPRQYFIVQEIDDV